LILICGRNIKAAGVTFAESSISGLSSKEIYFDDGTTLSLPTESSWAAVTDTDFQGEMKLICDTELQ